MNFAVIGTLPGAWLMAVMSRWMLQASRPVVVSRRSTAMLTAMLAAAARIRDRPRGFTRASVQSCSDQYQ